MKNIYGYWKIQRSQVVFITITFVYSNNQAQNSLILSHIESIISRLEGSRALIKLIHAHYNHDFGRLQKVFRWNRFFMHK